MIAIADLRKAAERDPQNKPAGAQAFDGAGLARAQANLLPQSIGAVSRPFYVTTQTFVMPERLVRF